MKRLLQMLCVLPLLSGFFVFTGDPVKAAVIGCQYGSTQARVQRDITDPWKSDLTITRGQSFNVGGFHNHTGQFGHDVVIQVVGPNWANFYGNGQNVWPPFSGQYTVYVNTRDQFGGGCSEQARVNVVEPVQPVQPVQPAQPVQPQPVFSTCQYGSTQARVQQDIQHPWAQYIITTQSQGFNVGGFHNGTGQFAHDTQIQVYGSGFSGLISYNGTRILPPGTGWYLVRVSTYNQSGRDCQEDAWVWVN